MEYDSTKYSLRLLAGSAGASAVVAGLAACNLVAGLGDFDRAVDAAIDSGAKKDSALADVQSMRTDTSTGDDDDGAPSDDSSPADDGGDDAADMPDADDGSTGFCVTSKTAQTVFCRDFDDGKSASGGWTGSFFKDPTDAVFPPDAGMLVTSTTDDFFSSPASALLVVPALPTNASGDSVYGQLQVALQYHPQITINFAFKCPDFNPASNLSLLRLANTSSTWSVTLGVYDTSVYVTPGAAQTDGALVYTPQYVAQPDLTQWTTISLFLDLTNGVATVSYNGVVAPGSLALNTPDLAATGGGLLLAMGLNYASEPLPTAQHLYYDNIDVEAQ